MKKPLILLIGTILSLTTLSISVYAHPGKTDGAGGHYDHQNGGYHYHHGYPAHSHTNGDCPYNYDDKTDHTSNNGTSSSPENFIYYDEATANAHTATQTPKAITFGSVIKAMLSGLLPAIAIFFSSSYFLSYIFFAIWGKDKGCSAAIISGIVISIIGYIWLIIAKLT